MDNTEEFRLLSLCSGYAGIELGLRRVVPNLRTVAYVEVEAFAVANLVSKMEKGLLDAAPIWTDIKTFNGWPFRKNVHIITTGYPCQGESCAGKRKGQADPRWLWPHIERIIEAVQPLWFFGENVSGHLTLGFPTVYRSLRNLGYTVEAGLFTAAECGAPHRRERLFILAHNSNGQGYSTDVSKPAKKAQFESCNDSRKSQLADTEGERQRATQREPNQKSESRNYGQGQMSASGDGCCRWPARPGQPQYEWEEPRVVDNALQRRHQQKKEQIQTRRNSPINTDKGQAQSRLGGEFDGDTIALDIAKGIRGGYLTKPGGEIGHNLVMEAKQRVDRLRLLGNGVVPQQAEKAFRTLMELFV